MGACCSAQIDIPKDSSRKCTDKFWLIIFVICWVILSAVSFWSLIGGHPNRIIQGYDSFGNICGQRNKRIPGVSWSGLDMRDKPFVFHMNPVNVSFTMKICVKSCAEKNMTQESDILLYSTRSSSNLFRYDYDPRGAPSHYSAIPQRDIIGLRKSDEARGFGPLPILPVTKQRPILHRCVGTDRIKLGNSLINNVYSYIKNQEIAHKIVSDIHTSWHNICYTVLFGIAISIFVTFTIHYLASIVSFAIMTLSTIALLALTGFSWYVYYDLRYKLNSIPSIDQLDDDLINEKTFLVFSILLTIITAIILIATYFMSSRIGLMVALFSETGACLRSMPALIVQPIWTCTVLILFFIYWTTVFSAIASTEDEDIFNASTTRFQLALPARRIEEYNNGLVTFAQTAELRQLESVKHHQPKYITYMIIFLIVMLFWSAEFMLGCQQMTVASSVASWYFTRDKSTLTCPIGNSIIRTAKYHLGSVAKGSFLIVLFKIPRLILAYLEYILKQYKDKSTCVKCAFNCCHCFWYCMENFIRYINHNAYTIIAIEGTPYCFSARVAFNTLASNTLRILTINTMGDFIIFLGKCLVTGGSAIFGVYLVRHDPSVHYIAVPIIFAAIVTYAIAHSMLCVYEMVIDTMFLCFVEDIKKNKDSPEGYFASESLLKFAADDIEENKTDSPTIVVEQNASSRQPKRQADLVASSNGRDRPDVPPVGFVYPKLGISESSH